MGDIISKSVVFLRSNPVQPDPRVEKEVNSLIKSGYNVIVIAWDRNEKYKIRESYLNLQNGKAKIYRFGILATYCGGIKNNLKPLILFQMRLIQWLFKNRKMYKTIHACDFDTAFVAYICANILKKKLIYDIFDYYVDAFSVPRGLRKIIQNIDHRVINYADGVIICTEKRKEQIKGTIPKILTVVHNSPSLSIVRKSNLDLNQDKVKISYVGILAEERLLKELSVIIMNNSNLELHIGGFGQLEGYFKEISKKYDNIIYYGKLEYSKTIELENSCDIMVAVYDPNSPNNYFAAPNKFYEALMLGKPIIMARNTGIDHIVSENNIGEVIEYNSESLKCGIENLIKHKKEWYTTSCKMKQIYDNTYNWDVMEKRLLNLYKSISINNHGLK